MKTTKNTKVLCWDRPEGSIEDALEKEKAIRDKNNNNTSISYVDICHRDLFMNEDIRQVTIDVTVEIILHDDEKRKECQNPIGTKVHGLHSTAFEQRLFKLSLEQSKMAEV
jgi:hypothetical protein